MLNKRINKIAKELVAADSDIFHKAVAYIRAHLKTELQDSISTFNEIEDLLDKFTEENGLETEWYEQEWWEKDGFTIQDFYNAL